MITGEQKETILLAMDFLGGASCKLWARNTDESGKWLDRAEYQEAEYEELQRIIRGLKQIINEG